MARNAVHNSYAGQCAADLWKLTYARHRSTEYFTPKGGGLRLPNLTESHA
jgi:hypothetical protein